MTDPTIEDLKAHIADLTHALGLPADMTAQSRLHYVKKWRDDLGQLRLKIAWRDDALKSGDADFLAKQLSEIAEVLGATTSSPADLPLYVRRIVGEHATLSGWQERLLSENATLHKAHAHNAIDRLLSALKAPLRYDGGEPLTREERIEWAIRRAPKT
jgi:hypothetical protein